MRIQDGVIYFDNLVQADREMIGETRAVTAKLPESPFHAPNASGGLCVVSSIEDAGKLGKDAAGCLKAMFN